MTSSDFLATSPIELLTPAEAERAVAQLGVILEACVSEGSGVGFVLPFSQSLAETFWRGRLAGLMEGSRHTLIARHTGAIAGTVSLELAPQPNARHRAEISKLLVHPEARRLGLARKLLQEAERLAVTLGRTLLVLDTVTGDRAERLYPTCGFVRVGVIPNYAVSPAGTLDATTVFYKDLTVK
ncbi:GNAT family N-acetyltransferase [Roseibium sp. CAU 1637]|uniref:GNAT family N-acetyltransferase n=1 Tax=Roseibium limicola TaxID=2816037 RepID=A0A939EPK2_9HYPH|nr:GNAT family N-acetyltransferase [Roseibium limicola]MBO0345153.1 GNAT family N-acetyltransferase [Roseibium limicola]